MRSKALKILLGLLVGSVVLIFGLRWLIALASPTPDDLGVTNGRLTPCPESPNCVSTLASDELHAIAPISYSGETAAARATLLAILQAESGFTIISNTPTYIHIEARTAVWHFIDDVEFYLPEGESVIHFRSASRLGQGDSGVNRRRMEAVRMAFQSK